MATQEADLQANRSRCAMEETRRKEYYFTQFARTTRRLAPLAWLFHQSFRYLSENEVSSHDLFAFHLDHCHAVSNKRRARRIQVRPDYWCASGGGELMSARAF